MWHCEIVVENSQERCKGVVVFGVAIGVSNKASNVFLSRVAVWKWTADGSCSYDHSAGFVGKIGRCVVEIDYSAILVMVPPISDGFE